MTKFSLEAFRFFNYSHDGFAKHNGGRVVIKKLYNVLSTEIVDFGVKDRFGRSLGTKVTVSQVDVIPGSLADNVWYVLAGDVSSIGARYFAVEVQAQRNERKYGAIGGTTFFGTLADAEAYITKYLNDAAKRAKKNEGK